MFKAWLQSGILQSFLLQINPVEKRSSEHEAQLGLKARKTLTYDPVLFKGKIEKEKDKQPASWGVKISSNCQESALKGFKIAYLVTQKPEHFPQHHQLAEAFKFKSKAFPFVYSKAHQLTSYRFPSVSGFLKRKIP